MRSQPTRQSKTRRPATTDEGREAQLVSLAMDLAEKQLADGTASAQVLSHFLKQGSSRERLEQEKIGRENQLLGAKVGRIESERNVEELYRNAINAMKIYSGEEPVYIDEDIDVY